MTVDPGVLDALRAAVAADPSKPGIRRHLAGLLAEAGRDQEALAEARAVLAAAPADVEALGIAARAAGRLGEESAASGYRSLLAALAGEGPTAPPGGAGAGPPSPGGEVVRLRLVRGQGAALDEDPAASEVEVPEVTLADVGGLAEVKRRLELAFLAPMRSPELRAAYRKSLRGGLLLYGPPGCGKTFLARALAGELSARFVSVELSDVLDMWLGQSEKNLHELFELARRNAPCVLFVDELDALGRSRSLMRHHAAMAGVVNQFLAEMDGAKHRNEGVFVLAATNQPWDVDPALRRPGRLDRTLLVLPPDREARVAILRVHLRDRPLEDGLDLDAIARDTEDFSGADLAHLCEVAAELAMEESAASGRVRPITARDLKRARKEVRPSIRPWLETARNYALFANEGGAYDELVDYLRRRKLA